MFRHCFPREGGGFNLKNTINFKKIINEEEFKPSRLFAVKVKYFTNLIHSIEKALGQDSKYRGILKDLGEGSSVEGHSLDLSSQLLLFEDWVVVLNDPTTQLRILQDFHDSPLAGHPVQEMTLKFVKWDFHWYGMTQLINDYVTSCKQCSRNKNINHKMLGILKSIPIPNVP
ncbi:hypothetical protein O181_060143 [Austropuccinia psidii MF-1]|uniref:Integrase zinc-binding domain-containing protein n=1 Tax=Austropuccinia psidii MF-1 TaxID=1389203 RepID=A0A9Q3EG04_9BASI|nr:hypothetical protein [Austropuccinia psidii MF-1]